MRLLLEVANWQRRQSPQHQRLGNCTVLRRRKGPGPAYQSNANNNILIMIQIEMQGVGLIDTILEDVSTSSWSRATISAGETAAIATATRATTRARSSS